MSQSSNLLYEIYNDMINVTVPWTFNKTDESSYQHHLRDTLEDTDEANKYLETRNESDNTFSKNDIQNSMLLSTGRGDIEDLNEALEVSFGDSANSIPPPLRFKSSSNKFWSLIYLYK